MIEMVGLPTATPELWPRFAGLLLVLLSVVLHAGRRRHRSLPHRGLVRASASRLAGVSFFLVERAPYLLFGLFDFVFLVPQAILLLIAVRGTPRECCWSTRGMTTAPAALRLGDGCSSRRWSCSAWPARIFTYDRFFREQPAPFFASDEDHFLFGSIGTEGARRCAVLDVAGAAAHLPGPAARARRLRLARRPRQGRPRDADRPLEGHGRLPTRRHQLRDVPHRAHPPARPAICR